MLKNSFDIIELYENEVRAVEYELYFNNSSSLNITSANFEIFNSNLDVIVSRPCMITGNKISTLITEDVTATKGDYKIIWTIEINNQIYKNRTNLKIREI